MPSTSTIAKITVLRNTPGLWEGGAGRDSIVWIFPASRPQGPPPGRLTLLLSPDGKAAQMIITDDVDPATPEGISHIETIRHAAQEAVQGTPLWGRTTTCCWSPDRS